MEELSKEEKEELQKLTDEITEEAKNVIEDYANNPSEISGSVVEINEHSPFLDERIPEGKGWEKVLKGLTPADIVRIQKKKKNKKKA